MRRRSLSAMVAGAALVLVACGGDDSGSATTDAPPAAQDTTTTSAAAAPAPDCGDPVASYEPTFPLPEPGEMPGETHMQEIQDRGRLIVGTSADVLRFGFRDPITGEIQGFDVDVLHAVADAIFGDPNAIEYRVINYAERLPSLTERSVDIVAHTMTINCARWQEIAFSTEYYHAGQTVLVGIDSEATGIESFVGTDQKVCVAKGSTNLEELENNYPTIERVEMDDLTDCLVLFQQSAVDAITGDNTVMAGFEAQDPFAKQVGEQFTDEPYGLGINHSHPEFVEFVNLVLEQMRQDGSLLRLQQQWIDDDTPPPPAVYGREPVG